MTAKRERKQLPDPRTHGHVWQREMIAAARRLTRLERDARATRRRLKDLEANIRLAKRELKAITAAAVGPDPLDQAPPLRMFGETQG